MKLQVCEFQRRENGPWETGVAKLTHFDVADIDCVIDEAGQTIGISPDSIWTYKLLRGPGFYLSTE